MNAKRTISFVLGGLLAGQAALAQQDQVEPGSKGVWRNARIGAVSARRPGLMVQQGISRYNNAQGDIIARARNGPEITQTEEDQPTKVITQAKADVITILFENLTALIVAYNTQLRLNAGLSPTIPTPDGTSTDGNGNLADLLGQITGPGS